MITAVDTSVLVDIAQEDQQFGQQSRVRLTNARMEGQVIVCNVVYAELVRSFGDRSALDGALRELGITISPLDTHIAYHAGLRWAEYRRAGGPRSRILPDFLIGAHALVSSDAFLTRDKGFYLTYFPELNWPSVV